MGVGGVGAGGWGGLKIGAPKDCALGLGIAPNRPNPSLF